MLVDPNALVWSACPYFRWSEFSGWEHADAVRVARAQQLVRDLLCPLRKVVGRVDVGAGGWYWSRHGYPRDKAHGEGAAVDIVPADVELEAAYEWLRDRSWYGELILEGDHVHVTLPGFGGNLEALIEQSDGTLERDPLAPTARDVVVTAGLHELGAAMLITGAAVGLWRLQERKS